MNGSVVSGYERAAWHSGLTSNASASQYHEGSDVITEPWAGKAPIGWDHYSSQRPHDSLTTTQTAKHSLDWKSLLAPSGQALPLT